MTAFVLDASITMAWCFEDEADTLCHQVLLSFKSMKALVPALWLLEVSNVLLVAERKKRIKPADSLRFASLIKTLPIHIDESPPAITDLLHLGRSHNLSSYDATYLLLAMKNGLPIATQDRDLIKAAQDVGVLLHPQNAILF